MADTPPSPHAHFSQGGLGTGGGTPPLFAAALPVLLPMFLIVVPVLVLQFLGRFAWIPWEVRLELVTIPVFIGLWFAGKAIERGYRRGTDIRGLPMAMDESRRVNVICWNDQRRELESLGDIAFEPERFRAFLPAPLFRSTNISQRITRALPTVIFPAIYLPLIFRVPGVLMVVVPLVIALVLWTFRRPTYLIITPGRVDILRYPTLGGPDAAPDIETIDLRSQPLRLDLKSHALRVGPWTKSALPQIVGTNPQGPDPAAFTLPLWGIIERHRAEWFLYLAAISTANGHQPPAICDQSGPPGSPVADPPSPAPTAQSSPG